MNKLILLLLIFIANTKTYANCAPKDLTDPTYMKSIGKENLIKHFQSPRDQDGTGWCSSYSSSDSLTFAIGEPVSALDVSINYFANKYKNRNDSHLNELGGISPQFAPEMAEDYGYCPESVIPTNQTSSSNLGQKAIFKLLETFQEIYDEFIEKGRPADFCVDCIKSYEKMIKPIIPNATSNLIKNILLKNQGDSLSAFKDMLNKLCDGRRVKIKTQFQIISKNQLGNKTVASVLDDALENNSMPSFGMNSSYFANANSVPGGYGPHELMIVAKRMNSSGVCEYLVRNSWGKGCSYYLPHIAEKCDDAKGSFWMDQNQLQEGVTDLLIIQNERNLPMPIATIIPDTQETASNANTQKNIVLTTTQNNPSISNTQNKKNTSITQNISSIVDTQNTPSIAETQNTPSIADTQNTPSIADTQNTVSIVETKTTTSSSDLAETEKTAEKLEPIEQIAQVEKTIVSDDRKFSIFNIFKRKSNTDINSKANTINHNNKDLPITSPPKERIIDKFSKFFSSIWKSLSKAFKY